MFDIYFSPNFRKFKDIRKSVTLDAAAFKAKLVLLKQVIIFVIKILNLLFPFLSIEVVAFNL